MKIKKELIHHLALEELAGVISEEDLAYLSRIIRENPEAFEVWQETRTILNTPDVKEFLARPRSAKDILLLPNCPKHTNFWQPFSLSVTALLIISLGFSFLLHPLEKTIPATNVVSHKKLLSEEKTVTLPLQKGAVKTENISLPDSTTIWVNSATTLQFPLAFTRCKKE
ncbi:hypothetical protein SAMN05518672_1011030 [Chitinophaga sp. CF118]|uniref:hypothetical protein n=1 Tax=Chitinophaga sp. CF118 TaxID=1884367 RepID=UPI0008ED30D7|nr:hypothetical protein [Chitinophaga sp. CF118]SFD20450.1 hypothetical protein SAMN05518672_1011030 [Chitinophaga sp. CF118]